MNKVDIVIIIAGIFAMIFALVSAVRFRINLMKQMSEKSERQAHLDRYCVKFGEDRVCINSRLIESQDCAENEGLILHLHRIRLGLHAYMEVLSIDKDFVNLKLANDLYTQLEYKLQDAWKFTRDSKFHRFWLRPGCSCPQMDNEDFYPYQSIISGGCKIHGKLVAPIKKKVAKKKTKKKSKKKVSSGKTVRSKANSKKNSKASTRKHKSNYAVRKKS